MSTKVRLLRPLDGRETGSEVEYPDVDAKRLLRRGAVELLEEKAAEPPANKKAPAVANKAAQQRVGKGA